MPTPFTVFTVLQAASSRRLSTGDIRSLPSSAFSTLTKEVPYKGQGQREGQTVSSSCTPSQHTDLAFAGQLTRPQDTVPRSS